MPTPQGFGAIAALERDDRTAILGAFRAVVPSAGVTDQDTLRKRSGRAPHMAHRSGARAVRRERGAAVGVSHVPECKRAAPTCSRSAVTGGAAGTADGRRTCFRERSAGASRVTARSASRHAHPGASAPAGRNLWQSKALASTLVRYRERSVCRSHVPVTRRVPSAPVPASQRRRCGRGRCRARSHVPGTQRVPPTTCYRAVSAALGAGTLPRVLSARPSRSASARTVIR